MGYVLTTPIGLGFTRNPLQYQGFSSALHIAFLKNLSGYIAISSEHLTTLYWTLGAAMFKVHPIMTLRTTCFSSLIAVLTLLFSLLASSAHAGQALAVSADDAHAALSKGAFVLDVRSEAQFTAGHLRSASRLPADTATRSLNELAALISQAGADSSRTILIVGEPGDANAQALWQRLASVVSGRVLWLVGGVAEWQMTGRPLSEEAVTHKAVPQFLTPFDAQAASSRMAGSRVRSSELLERNLRINVAGL
jgi:rhodanese-related sulfurtransferase